LLELSYHFSINFEIFNDIFSISRCINEEIIKNHSCQNQNEEEENFYFKPIKHIENSPSVINKIEKKTKIKSKKLIMLSSGMPVYVESPDTTLSNSNKPNSNNNNNNNTQTNSKTSDHSVSYQPNFNPPAISLLDETSSLTTTASNSNTTTDDLKKIKKMYNMRPNLYNYCNHSNKYFETTITTTTATSTSENENISNNSSSLDSINYSSQNHSSNTNKKKSSILHDSSSWDKNNSFSISSAETGTEFYKSSKPQIDQQPLTKLPNFDFGKNKINSNSSGKELLNDKIELKILPLKISSSSIILNKMTNSNNLNDSICNCCYCINNHFDYQQNQGNF
jgi:hypothetical protein